MRRGRRGECHDGRVGGYSSVEISRCADVYDDCASGYAAFLNPDVNRCFRDVLNEWGRFLQVSRLTGCRLYKASPLMGTFTLDIRISISPGEG